MFEELDIGKEFQPDLCQDLIDLLQEQRQYRLYLPFQTGRRLLSESR